LKGEPAAARTHLAAARAHLDHYGETFVAAELCRLEALLLQAEGATRETIEDRLDEALRIGHEQEARLFELRSATVLAQFWAEHGERRRGYDLLAPLYASFTEGFGTKDLRRANILLDELRS
jgi:predicted ATPase